MIERLGSLYRVEWKDGPFNALAYIVADDIKEAKELFTSSHMWIGKPFIAISKSYDNVYGEKNE